MTPDLPSQFLDYGRYMRAWSSQTIRTYDQSLRVLPSELSRASLNDLVVALKKRGLANGGIYDHWFVKRPRLTGTVVQSIWAEHPRSGHGELMSLLHKLRKEQWGERLELQDRAAGAVALNHVRDRIARFTEGLGAPNLRPDVGDFFAVEIKNIGSTTLHDVRLLCDFPCDALVVRGDDRNFVNSAEGHEELSVPSGTLRQDDRVLVYAWSLGINALFVRAFRSQKNFRLTHAEGRGRMVKRPAHSLRLRS